VVQTAYADKLHVDYGTPEELWLRYDFHRDSTEIDLTVSWFNKTATRIPEAFWMRVDPSGAAGNWTIDKLGEWVDITDDYVLQNGSTHIHAVHTSVLQIASDPDLNIRVDTLDAPLVCLGEPTPFPVPFRPPDMSHGVSFNLYANTWGTNYIMWYPYLDRDRDSKFRFHIQLEE